MSVFQTITLQMHIQTKREGYRTTTCTTYMWSMQSKRALIIKAITPGAFMSLYNRYERGRKRKLYEPIMEISRDGTAHSLIEIEYEWR